MNPWLLITGMLAACLGLLSALGHWPLAALAAALLCLCGWLALRVEQARLGYVADLERRLAIARADCAHYRDEVARMRVRIHEARRLDRVPALRVVRGDDGPKGAA